MRRPAAMSLCWPSPQPSPRGRGSWTFPHAARIKPSANAVPTGPPLPRSGKRGLEEGALQQQHGVAEAVETILPRNGLLIGPRDQLTPGEGADQRQQRRARQVKVRNHHIYHAELVARRDEEPRAPAIGRYHTLRARLGG